jgi:hypothetical protein
MPRRHRIAATVGLSAWFSLIAVAFASNPAKSSKFKGTASGSVTFATTFTAKDPLTFKTSRSGMEVLSFAYTDTVCDLAASDHVAVGTIKISGGKFSLSGHKSAPVADSLQDGGTVVTTTSVKGTFVSPKSVSGTLEYRQKQSGAPGASCGPIKLSFRAATA